MNYDDDGFAVGGVNPPGPLREPPVTVQMPSSFSGCASLEDAMIRMINKLQKPYSSQIDGFDTGYRNIADALIVLLAAKVGLMP